MRPHAPTLPHAAACARLASRRMSAFLAAQSRAAIQERGAESRTLESSSAPGECEDTSCLVLGRKREAGLPGSRAGRESPRPSAGQAGPARSRCLPRLLVCCSCKAPGELCDASPESCCSLANNTCNADLGGPAKCQHPKCVGCGQRRCLPSSPALAGPHSCLRRCDCKVPADGGHACPSSHTQLLLGV